MIGNWQNREILEKLARKGLIPAFLFLMGFEVLVIWPQELDLPYVAEAPPIVFQKETAEQTMTGVHLVETREGGKEWELWSEKAKGFKDQGFWGLEEVKVRLFGKDDASYVVTGKTGKVGTEKRDLEITGDVVIKSSNGYTFKSSKIVYETKSQEIQSPGAVEVYGPSENPEQAMELLGQNLIAKMTDNTITITSDVRARRRVSAQRVVAIRSDRAFLSGRDSTARFDGNVIVDSEGARLTGPAAEFAMDQETNQVRSLLVHGGVKITDLEKLATADRVLMEFLQDRFILRGSPRVVQNSDELRGEEIVFLNNGKQIEVRGARARFENAESKGHRD